MSILPQALQHPLDSLQHLFGKHLFPGSCLLCGANSGDSLLCSACTNDLPHYSGPACPQCASPTAHGEHCGACLQQAPAFDSCIALFRYDFPVDRIIQALKYGHQLAIARWLGQALARHPGLPECDDIIGLPLHPTRLQERGFNQSIEIARAISQYFNRPLRLDTLQRTRATTAQAGLPLKARQANVRGAFECSADLSGRRILLIDDVLTTGATLDECARILKLHGAVRVNVAVAARALKH